MSDTPQAPYSPPQAPLHSPSGSGPAPDHMVFAILATIVGGLFSLGCCCIFPSAAIPGIVAIVMANKTKAFNAAGNYEEAQKSSGQAKIWAIVASVIGGLGLIWGLLSTLLNVAALGPEMFRNL